ncbi:gephyrin-like molybdotransferase Glp [Planctobacterium marinum]|uniref:Molybdopterin molybdenumtransferase n=1 Tax=Planctobacterium marinum TaxID=1631968 RepID=A0AA48KSV7_9ALTE|nr:molybdopterin molybdenumtransferase MoeA [Planctobacterium marinum]
MSVCDAPGLLPIEDALTQQTAQIRPLQETEVVDLKDAAGRIVAEDVISEVNVPPHDNSAMDGYALRAADAKNSLQIIGQSLAGHAFSSPVTEGQALRLMTGSPVPQGADTVIMQEQTEVIGRKLRCLKIPQQGTNIRRKGEDIQQGSVVVNKGVRLSAPHLSLLASIGHSKITVVRKINIAVMATGDELVVPGTELQSGQIYESNRIGIITILQKLGCNVIDLGIIPDELETTRNAFTEAAKQCDWVITSGGVSVGDADFVKPVLEELGEINFWKVAIKPGKPYAFGKLGSAFFSGLPGNPVSSFVTLIQLVIPCLKYLAGETSAPQFSLKAKLMKDIRRAPGRTEYLRARAWQNEQGELCVLPQPKQGSGIMNSFTQANCFVVVAADCAYHDKDTMVNIQLFDELLK